MSAETGGDAKAHLRARCKQEWLGTSFEVYGVIDGRDVYLFDLGAPFALHPFWRWQPAGETDRDEGWRDLLATSLLTPWEIGRMLAADLGLVPFYAPERLVFIADEGSDVCSFDGAGYGVPDAVRARFK